MNAQWLELSMTVDGELAEAVAEVLRRYMPEGVVIESTSIESSPDDAEGWISGPLRVYGYLPVDDQLATTRQRLEESLWYLSRIRPLPELKARLIEEENWAEAWKQHYQPVAIGRRLMIVPAWLQTPDPTAIVVRIDPGMAFGTGTHPSTQLCLEILEDLIQPESLSIISPLEVIDLGCGTGILAIAAVKLGALKVLAVDNDAEAIKAAHQNAQVNDVTDRLELGRGSLAEIAGGLFSIRKGQIVMVNILAPVIQRLLDEGLAGLVNYGGYLVLAGILDEQAPEVKATARRYGLELQGERHNGDWVALVFQGNDQMVKSE